MAAEALGTKMVRAGPTVVDKVRALAIDIVFASLKQGTRTSSF